MAEIVTGYDGQIREWVSHELGIEKVGGDKFSALGIMHDNALIGGAVYHDYQRHNIEMSLATTDKRWCTRKILKGLLSYPFEQLGVVRVGAMCSKKNRQMRSILERIGFKMEGCARKAFDGKNDAIIYSMLNNECRWLK